MVVLDASVVIAWAYEDSEGRLDALIRHVAAGAPRIQSLPIRVDDETSLRGWEAIPALAERFRLTTYDAAYLELALRFDVPLATLDQDLARAAREAGVPLFE